MGLAPSRAEASFWVWFVCVGLTVEVTAQELHAQRGPDVVVGGVDADVPGHNWGLEMVFLHSSCIHVSKEQLQGKGAKGLLYQWKERWTGQELLGRRMFMSGTSVSYHHPYNPGK